VSGISLTLGLPTKSSLAIVALLNTLVASVQISAQFSPLNVNPTFKRAVQLAVDRAVRDVS
jgi:CCR4-NOT transcription complex subunit 1